MTAKPINNTQNGKQDKTTDKKPAPKSPRKITKDYLKNSGAFYLGRYSATTHQFKLVMNRKIKRSIEFHGEPSRDTALQWLDEILQDFIRLGYLNDDLYAVSYARGLKQKGLSSRIISQKMTEKNISIPDDFEIDDLSQILKFMKRKKLGIFGIRSEDPKKLLAKLARNGFSFTVCQKALAIAIDEIEEFMI